jgi:hypothetical protein
MNRAYLQVIAASDNDRRDLFIAAARRLGTTEQNVEKDFWVCWTLDALFNGLAPGGPRLLFKGGTSLSKSYGLIDRFSEDIDVTVFRDDIGQAASIAALEALSGKKRATKLDAIRAACQAYVNGALFAGLSEIIARTLEGTGIPAGRARLEPDGGDPDRQTLTFWYPSATAGADGYVRPAVKIESGAKSALDPNRSMIVRPYVADDLGNLDLTVSGVTTAEPSRTFWDKVVILHGLRCWFDRRGILRQEGQRVSRHYYDVHRLAQSAVGTIALANIEMAIDCARHARMFFNRPDFDLESAVAGRFSIIPADGMIDPLRRDYMNMAGMIFGTAPSFEMVMASIAGLQDRLAATIAPHSSA